MSNKVFLVTGCSSGFGNHLIQTILDKGAKAIATGRNPDKLQSFKGTTNDNFLALKLDVTDQSSVDAAFKKAVDTFGRVDVVVNNAGYGLAGEFESLTEEQMRKQMEVNFFGLTNVTRRAMQVMREQSPSGGLIQQITSIGGQLGVPFFSTYCASKWAVEGFTEAISKEVKPEWGIKFTCIEPGGFRTEWAGASMEFAGNKNKAYDHLDAEKSMKERNGTQAGEPKKGAERMYDLAVMEDPPLRVVIGSDAYKGITQKLEDYKKNYTRFEELSNSTDVEE